jgi:hypothetical protein
VDERIKTHVVWKVSSACLAQAVMKGTPNETSQLLKMFPYG